MIANQIGSKGGKALLAALEINTTLTEMNLKGNATPSVTIDEVTEFGEPIDQKIISEIECRLKRNQLYGDDLYKKLTTQQVQSLGNTHIQFH